MNSRELFQGFADDARVWVFAFSRPVDPSVETQLRQRMTSALTRWFAHGKPLTAACEILSGRFLIVAADEKETQASGCSIDVLTRETARILDDLNLQPLRHSSVLLIVDREIVVCTLAELDTLKADGKISADTVVINTLISRVGDLRAEKWLVPLGTSVYAQRLSF